MIVPQDKKQKQIEAEEKQLSPKRLLFCHEYVKDLNGAQAAIRAGYSPKAAKEQAARLLTNANVKAEIDAQLSGRLKRLGIDKDRVLIELARIAYHDHRKLFKEDGSLKPPSEWDDETAAAISAIEILEEFDGIGRDRVQIGWTKKVKMHSKIDALVTLAKHLRLLTDKIEFPDKNGNPQDVANKILIYIPTNGRD